MRQLAVELRINANTVAKVYAELERMGFSKRDEAWEHLSANDRLKCRSSAATEKHLRSWQIGYRRSTVAWVFRWMILSTILRAGAISVVQINNLQSSSQVNNLRQAETREEKWLTFN